MFHNLGGLQQDTRVEKKETAHLYMSPTDRTDSYVQCQQITGSSRGHQVIFLSNSRASVKEQGIDVVTVYLFTMQILGWKINFCAC